MPPGHSQTTFARWLSPVSSHRLCLSKGVHILLPLDKEDTKDAILIPETDDGRVIFAIPWLGRFLVGTTDDEATGGQMVVTKAEAEYLLRHFNRYIVHPLRVDQIVSASRACGHWLGPKMPSRPRS